MAQVTRLRLPSKTRVAEENGRLGVKRRGNPHEVEKRDIPLATLEFPHVRPINSSGVRQCLLRKLCALTARSNGLPESQKRSFRISHSCHSSHDASVIL